MRAILIIMLILSPLVGMSQTVLFTGSPSMLTYHKGALGADSILKIPFADTAGIGSLWPDSLRKGGIMINSADTMLYYHDGNGWRVVGSADASADTNFIRNQFAYDQEGNFRVSGFGAAGKLVAGNLMKSSRMDSSYVMLILSSLPIAADDFPIAVLDSFNSSNIDEYSIRSGLIKVDDSNRINDLYIHVDDEVTILLQGDTARGSVNVGAALMPYHIIAGYGAIDETFHLTSTPNVAHNIQFFGGIISLDSAASQYGFLSHIDSTVEFSRPIPRDRIKKYGFAAAGGAPNYFGGKTLFSRKTINDGANPALGQHFPLWGPHMDTFAQDFAVKILGNLMYKPGTEGAGKILTSSADGTVTISDPSAVIGGDVFVQDGNAFGETAVLGTTDNEALELIAGGNTALRVNPDATVQYTDGTQGDGKILMSSADGTLSAQSPDTVLKGVWRSGVINNMGTQATLRADADTITISGIGSTPLMQSVGSRMAFNDIVRGTVDGMRFIGSAPSTGSAGAPIIFEGRFPSGATGNRFGTIMRAAGTTPTSVSVLSIGRSNGATWTGITDENWGATAAATNYFMRVGSFQPSSTNWFLFTQNPVKSQLSGNLLLGATTDNGHKLQVSGSIYGRNQIEPFSQFIMAEPFTPSGTADASGEVGSMAWDEDYIYIKTSAGWKRSALSTF